MTELRECPFGCGVKIEPPFENLFDDEDEALPCWTIAHDCPVIRNRIWVTSMVSADDCVALWNTRAPGSAMDGEDAWQKVESYIFGLECKALADIRPAEVQDAFAALAAQPVGGSAVGLREALGAFRGVRSIYERYEGKSPTTAHDLNFLVHAVDLFRQHGATIEAALAHPASAAEGWRDISTAPKDRWILAAEHGHPDIQYAAYRARWHSDGYWLANCGQNVTQAPEPTHWVPDLAPPALSTDGADR